MDIKRFTTGPFSTHAYIVFDSKTQECVIIDAPPKSAELISDFIKNNRLIPRYLLLTHSHWDHIADASILKAQLDVPVLLHQRDRGNLEKPGSDLLPCWVHIDPTSADGWIEDEQKFTVGDLKFEIIHTPGHTPGGVCIFFPEQKWLFSGDTLFKGSIGNLAFPTAYAPDMWNSLFKLSTLPKETKVFAGHGNDTTIGDESWLANAEETFGD